MKKILLLLLLSFAGMVWAQSQAQTILVVGDSISAAYNIPLESGWVNLMQERLDDKKPGHYRVVNASVSGDTTAGGLSRLPDLLEEHNPDQVILELGGNDGLRGLPLGAMRSNLQAMIDLSREAGAGVWLVSVDLPRSYGQGFIRRYRRVFEELAEKNAIPHLPLGHKLLDGDESLIQDDGIHPTEEAQPLLEQAVRSCFIEGESEYGSC